MMSKKRPGEAVATDWIGDDCGWWDRDDDDEWVERPSPPIQQGSHSFEPVVISQTAPAVRQPIGFMRKPIVRVKARTAPRR